MSDSYSALLSLFSWYSSFTHSLLLPWFRHLLLLLGWALELRVPSCFLGDFNIILEEREKKGGAVADWDHSPVAIRHKGEDSYLKQRYTILLYVTENTSRGTTGFTHVLNGLMPESLTPLEEEGTARRDCLSTSESASRSNQY